MATYKRIHVGRFVLERFNQLILILELQMLVCVHEGECEYVKKNVYVWKSVHASVCVYARVYGCMRGSLCVCGECVCVENVCAHKK
jgi:hypothetical protein